jgi:hypothetical protein
MIIIELDTSDVAKWSGYFDAMAQQTPGAMARGLNNFGAHVKHTVLDYLSATTGLDVEAINSATVVLEASPGHLAWEMDAGRALLNDSDDWRRGWNSRPSDDQFDSQLLVDIVTQPGCCDVCAREAEGGPYTIEQVNELAAEWANFVPTGLSWLEALTRAPVTNMIHPNCRCTTKPHESAEQQSTFGKAADHILTPQELGKGLPKAVLDEVVTTFRAVVRGA